MTRRLSQIVARTDPRGISRSESHAASGVSTWSEALVQRVSCVAITSSAQLGKPMPRWKRKPIAVRRGIDASTPTETKTLAA